MGNFVAAIIINGEIEEAFDGDSVEEAINRSIQYFMVHRPAKSIKIVCHDERTEEVLESISMTDLND